jgi:formiminoglutamate deiminase
VTAYRCELAILADGVQSDVLIEVDGESIAAVRRGAASGGDEATRLRGLVIPGLANAHSHAFHRALRGRTQSPSGTGESFWTWRQQMYELADALTPDRYYELARAVFGERVLAGITAVGEFHYLHHDREGARYSAPNAIGEALIAAAGEAGLRITLLDACYLQGGIGAPVEGTQRRFSDGDAESWAARVDGLEAGPRTRIGAAIHSVRAVDPEAARVVAQWAREHDAPLHAHVSEQLAENDACRDAYGATPTAVLERVGALGGRFTAVHATHLADEDFVALGGAGATCCLCPTTERDLADGIGPGRRLAEAGSPLAVGTDSHASIDIFEEARAIELDERLASGRRAIHAPDALFAAATSAGHASIGWPEAGALRPGALCDMVSVDVHGPRLAGIDRGDTIASLIFAGTSADVRDVVVGGELVARDGAHGRIDVAAELAASIGALR